MTVRSFTPIHDTLLTCLLCLAVPSLIVWAVEKTVGKATDTVSNNVAKTVTDTQYEEGQVAATNGIPCEACPYFPSHYDPDYTLLREQWLKGWINKTIELKKGKP